MKIYHCIFDDETRADVIATSASEAMQQALELNLGHRITSCHSSTHGDPDSGWIDFEIPAHEPLLAIPPRRPRKLPDHTVPMFPDAQPSAHRDAAPH